MSALTVEPRTDIRAALEALCAPGGVPFRLRTVIVAAHPDDEVVGAAARLPRLRYGVIVHVTDGAPLDMQDAASHGFTTREAYARARREEARAALEVAGARGVETVEVGCVDQEASHELVALADRLAEILRELGPELVITHPYEGGHPDHDATAFAVHAACRMLHERRGSAPHLAEMTSYHMGPNGIRPYEFLPNGSHAPHTAVLTAEQQALKRRMLECFPTQQGTLQYFPAEIERFRPAPRYDFTEAPHPGMLFYEGFPWGMTGAEFRRRAAEALESLGMGGC